MGKIIVIEGTDFSGKTTQFELLRTKLGENVGYDSFPNYDSNSSHFVKQYLRGVYGESVYSVNAKAASIFYAIDRFESYKTREWGKIYDNGGNILFSRYISSNILHQASKLDTLEEVKLFIDWVYDFECGIFGLPKEEKVILLNMPPSKGQELKKKRLKESGGITSSGAEVDIHEANTEYLEKAYKTALFVAEYLNWSVVDCVDNKGELKSIEQINCEI